jgi:hypothetical protein
MMKWQVASILSDKLESMITLICLRANSGFQKMKDKISSKKRAMFDWGLQYL